MKKSLVFVFCIFISHFLLSQEVLQLGPDDLIPKSDTNKTEVYSASRSTQYIEDVPHTVYVISREEIISRGYIKLSDVLKDVPGIRVSQPGSALDGDSFLMNGLYGNNYCRILMDNIPVNPSVVGGMPLSAQLPIRQAERIEIISGTSSTLYGPDAVAGVINIITHASDRPVWSQADVSMGSSGFSNLNVMIGGKAGKNKNVLDYSFFGSYTQQSDQGLNYDFQNNFDPSLYDTNYLSAPGYKGDTHRPEINDLPLSSSLAGMKLRFRNLSFGYQHMERKTHASIGQNPAEVAYYDPARFWGERMDSYHLAYTNKWGKLSSVTQASYLQYRLNNNSSFRLIHDRGNEGVVYKYAASDDLLFEEILNWDLNAYLKLSSGASMQVSGNLPQTNELDSPFDVSLYEPFSTTVNFSTPGLGDFGISPRNFYNAGAYLQAIYHLRKFIVQAGGRWDQHSIYGSNISPGIGVQYKLSKQTSIRLNYGQAFKTPALFYAYNSLAYPVDNQQIHYEMIPNTALQAEHFKAFELGIRQKLGHLFGLEIIYMHHVLTQNISTGITRIDPQLFPNADSDYALSWVNDENSRAELNLFQINLRGENLIPAIRLNTELFINLSKGNEVLPNGLGTLNAYRNMPRSFVQFNLDFYPQKNWNIVLRNIGSGASTKRFFPLPSDLMEQAGFLTEVPGYFTLDVINKVKINRNFHVFFLVQNILDADYGGMDAYGNLHDLRYNQQMGRNMSFGLSFNME